MQQNYVKSLFGALLLLCASQLWGQTNCTLTASSSHTETSCYAGNDGSATAHASSGTAPYSYTWSDGQTTATAVNLTAGSYSVTVMDVNGCTATTSATITSPTALSGAISSSPESCAGLDGTASISPSGGTGSYSYQWSSGHTSASIGSLNSGSYEITFTDANGCSSISQALVGNSCASCSLTVSSNPINASCFGQNDGAASLNISSGSAPYQYLWSDGQTSATASNLMAGNYNVTVMDADGCTATTSANITSPTALSVNIVSSPENLGHDGSASATASGGTPPYTYLWSDGQTTATATNLAAGNYTLTISDANACTYSSSTNIDAPTAVSTYWAEAFNIFPNPNSGNMQLELRLNQSSLQSYRYIMYWVAKCINKL